MIIMNDSVISSLQRMIDVNTPIIYIHDYDFVRIDELILQVTANKKCLSGILQQEAQIFIPKLIKEVVICSLWKVS